MANRKLVAKLGKEIGSCTLCCAGSAKKQYDSALLWPLTVKTTFKLFSMSISLGNPLLPQRTK